MNNKKLIKNLKEEIKSLNFDIEVLTNSARYWYTECQKSKEENKKLKEMSAQVD